MATSTEAGVSRDGSALVFTGALDRTAATRLWRQALAALPGTQRFVLTNVTTVDSAGLALLAELAALLRNIGVSPQFDGEPSGLADLRAAYRLTPALDYPA